MELTKSEQKHIQRRRQEIEVRNSELTVRERQLSSPCNYPLYAHELLLQASCDLRRVRTSEKLIADAYLSEAYQKVEDAIAVLERHRKTYN